MFRWIGSSSCRASGRFTRRSFLHAGALSAAGLSLPGYLAAKARGEVRRESEDRAAILIFNLGAPSQHDTFDMKPQAPIEVRGPLRPIRTNVAGIQVSEILPQHARMADRFALVRSCHHDGPAVHEAGWQLSQTGRLHERAVTTPHAGCVLSYLRGARNGLPAHVLLPEPMGRGGEDMPSGQGAGWLGDRHDPFVLMADPAQPDYCGADALAASLTATGGRAQRGGLRDAIDGAVRDFEASPAARRLRGAAHDAYCLTTSPKARAAFDLSQEPAAVRRRYGMTRFGQCCLLARRLIEAGVRFVTINTFLTVFDAVTWDIHGFKPFPSLKDMQRTVAPMYDLAYSALIEDLWQRGMLPSTLVACLAEFGRTPKLNAAGGRDHWPQCWTVCFAGGGVQGGRVVGRSDATGAAPADRPVRPAEIVATVYHSLGLKADTLLPGPTGEATPVLDAGTQPITELF